MDKPPPPPHHLPPFRPVTKGETTAEPAARVEGRLTEQERAWLNEAIMTLAEIRLDLQARREYAVRAAIQMTEQDRRLDTAYSRLVAILRRAESPE